MKMAKTWNTDNIQYWQGYGTARALVHCWWEYKMIPQPWKIIGCFLTKLNIILPYDSATVLLSIYLKGLKILSTPKPVHKCL